MIPLPLLSIPVALFYGSPAGLQGIPLSAATVAVSAPETRSLVLEASHAQLIGNTLQQKTPGFIGKGYAGDFVPNGAKITWTLPTVRAGLYILKVRYCAPFGEKGYDLVVNGKRISGTLPKTDNRFTTVSGGRIELISGKNTIAIERGWGYFQINSVEITPSIPASPLKKVSSLLCDKQATAPTRALYNTLRGVYGKKTLSGQVEATDTNYLIATIHKTPAIRGGDFIEYSPTRIAHGSNPGNEVEQMIQASKNGQIITMLWHWNAPADLLESPYTNKTGKRITPHWWSGFYTDSTSFDLEQAINHPNSPKYRLLIRDVDTIAAQMKKFRDAGVPVLWRPLHEAEGGWFWWGARGSKPFKKLWRLMYNRMTNYHQLHNLIWVYSSGTNPDWYPGDDVVDIVGIDQYPTDPGDSLTNVWETLRNRFDGRKMLTLSEFGGVPDIAKMQKCGVQWSYFVSWQGDQGPHKHSVAELRRLYNAPNVITIKELPTIQK